MKLKSIAMLASTLIATAVAVPSHAADQSCSAGTCSKKAKKNMAQTSGQQVQQSCSKKEASCSKK